MSAGGENLFDNRGATGGVNSGEEVRGQKQKRV